MTSCANPSCDNPLPARGHTGRPAIYCSPACRQRRPRPRRTPPADPTPARPTPARPTADSALSADDTAAIVVELDHPDQSPDGRPVERIWNLRLRRRHHVVIIAEGLGWPTANALARQLTALLADTSPTQGAAID